MPDVGSIAAIFTSLKAAKDVAEAMVDLRDAAAFQSKLLEFQSNLIDANGAMFAAQDERTTLLQRVSLLEKEVANSKAWDARKQRYELKKLGYSAFAYMLKKDERGSEPPHCVCTNCFEDERISIIQYTIVKRGEGFVWVCPACKSTIDPHSGSIDWID
jgi:hypothetical protein